MARPTVDWRPIRDPQFGIQSIVAAGTAVAVTAVIWSCRSHYLFSWDSANYAFGVSRIDIAAHRPHPPGYLGYVFAARVLAALVPGSSVNAAFVAWNIVALCVAAFFTALLTDEDRASGERRFVAAAILLSSPLALFYAATAEIYVSEMACATAMAWAAREALRGRPHGLYSLALSAAVTAAFKLPALVLMLPLASYAFVFAPSRNRRAPLAVLAAALGCVALLFIVIQPGFVSVLWGQFVSSTSQTRVLGAGQGVDIGRVLNRNARDTLVAFLAALGLNVAGLFGWLIADRKPPASVGARFLAIWMVPWVAEFLLVHVAKPGYILPVLPAVVLILGAFYSRFASRARTIVWVSACVIGGLGWFLLASPPQSVPNDTRPYRSKPFLERMASDFGGLTFPTRATIRGSDRETELLLNAAARCSTGAWVVVAGSGRVDWRRAMYYLPAAVAINFADDRFQFVGRNGTFVTADGGEPVASACGLLWIVPGKPVLNTSAGAQTVPDVGWRYPPGQGTVTSTAITWTSSEAVSLR